MSDMRTEEQASAWREVFDWCEAHGCEFRHDRTGVANVIAFLDSLLELAWKLPEPFTAEELAESYSQLPAADLKPVEPAISTPEPQPVDGCQLIAQERKRQIAKEGWSAQHDDKVNCKGELARAAICYAATSYTWSDPHKLEDIWPYDSEWWKPDHKHTIRNLVKAGALIAAEIDRLQRTSKAQPISLPKLEVAQIAEDVFDIREVQQSESQSFEQMYDRLRAAGASAWDDVADPIAAVAEMRGDYDDLPHRVLAMCKARNWSLHWTARGAYLHLEASELIEALRGKRGDPTSEAADVLLVLMSITESNGINWASVIRKCDETVERLENAAPYPGEERGGVKA